ncbi:hypothetical protein ACFSC6_12560 [Rufibacter sediminis]|uniref:Uncharacterized protein n=1 Tax=Rufibacter sediminis TaxID=2762756 RepID=A0ABR6VUY5_9BACT|nr:hypothetical protein [Rufibacter sediminis]MBC3540714.1 hypothetical protein [Rufibacter sediminis]
MKVFLHYYKTLHAFNLPFSLFVSALIYSLERDRAVFFACFFFSFVFLGLVLAFYFFWLRSREQYYFYHNRGWSKRALLGTCFLVNAAFYILYLFCKPLLYGT